MKQPPDTTSEPAATESLFGQDTDGHDRWTRALDAESARIARNGHPASVALIDLDGPATDRDWLASEDAASVLPRLTQTIRLHAREADIVVTLGPGRYGVLLVNTDQVLAINFVERVRHACDTWLASQAIALRIAIGWADARPGRSIHEALADAEDALNRDRRAIATS